MAAVLEQAAVFERAAGPRLLRAERFVLAWPSLFRDCLLEVELGLEADGPLLLAVGRFKAAHWGPDAAARFCFWTNWTGGAQVALSDVGLRQRANFLTRLERCQLRRSGLPPAELGVGFDQLLTSLGVQRVTPAAGEPVRAQLELNLADPRTCCFEAATQSLFVATSFPPAIGDAILALVTVPGRPEPFRLETKVLLARTVPIDIKGQPAGFGLSLEGAPAELLEAFARMPARPVEAAERRAHVRHAVKAPVTVSAPRPVVKTSYASSDALLKDYVENLSIGGALIRTNRPLPLNTAVTLELQLLEGEVLRAAGSVVNVLPAGMGVQFHLEPAGKAQLEQCIARLRAGPSPGSAPELFRLRYATAAQLQSELPALLAGGVFLSVERELALQTPVRLELELPDGVVHLLKGKVVSSEPAGVGLEVDLEQWTRQRLKETLARSAATSPATQRPLNGLFEDPGLVASRLSVIDLVSEVEPAQALATNPAQRPSRLGNYELLSLLGRGGMAEVYFARAVSGPNAGAPVAIKRLTAQMQQRPDAVEFFLGEVDVLRLLDHPNIIKTLDVGSEDSQYYLVMEAIDGRNLAQILRRCRERQIFLPADFACFVTRCLLAGLDAVHRALGKGGASLELIHCDVSPENVFVSRDGEIKLGDFGLAQRASAAAPGAQVAGKASYFSPEALGGEISVGRDLWAANVTLYEMLTNQLPFPGATVTEQFDAIRQGRWKLPDRLRPGLDPALVEVVAKGFQKKRARRFQSAHEFAGALGPLFDPAVGTPLAIAAVVRGLFGAAADP